MLLAICPCDVTCAVLQVLYRCVRQPAVFRFHTFGCPTTTHHLPHAATGETTGQQAGASLRDSEWDTQPDQYLCISCPFAQVSSLIITAWRSFNELVARAKGRAGVTFPHAWAELDRLQQHGDRRDKATLVTLLLALLCGQQGDFEMFPAVFTSKNEPEDGI